MRLGLASMLICFYVGAVEGAMPDRDAVVAFDVSPTVQAQGRATFARTRYGKTRITIEIERLADPVRMSPPAGSFVVWVRAEGHRARNIGVLVTDASRVWRLSAATPLKDFELFVTAEATGGVPRPSGPRLLWTRRRK